MINDICVIGLGYVGLPLAHAFSKKFNLIGLDISTERIKELKSGFDRTLELSNEQVNESIKNGIKFTSNYNDAKNSKVYIITVPTPIDSGHEPDLNPIIKSTENVSKIISKNNIIIYESTVYPGLTEEIAVPILEKGSGLIGTKFDRFGDVVIGDIIVKVDNTLIENYDNLYNALESKKVGDIVRVEVIRQKKRKILSIKLIDLTSP